MIKSPNDAFGLHGPDRTPVVRFGPVAEHAAADRDDTPKGKKSTLVEITSVGYKRSMATEVRTPPRWGNAISVYIQHLRALQRSPDTVYLRGYQLRTFAQAFRGRDPWTLDQQDIENFMASLTVGLSASRSMQSAIRGFYQYGTKRRFCDDDPTIDIPSIEKVPGVPRPAPDAAIRLAIDKAEPRVRLMLYLGAYCGLRRSEIARVHTDDLHFDRRGIPHLRLIGKGRKKRVVPVTASIAQLIGECEPGWVFPSWHRGMVRSDGRAITDHLRPARVGELMAVVLRPVGVTPHQLRHRFASAMYDRNGHDIRAVQQALGHASVETTQTYTAVRQDAFTAGFLAAAELDA